MSIWFIDQNGSYPFGIVLFRMTRPTSPYLDITVNEPTDSTFLVNSDP